MKMDVLANTNPSTQGARTYYLRNIFHAWADPGCVEILVNIKSGMTEESVILIDETILPEKGVKPRGAQHDLEVMTSIGMCCPRYLLPPLGSRTPNF